MAELSAAAAMSQAPNSGRMLAPEQIDDLGRALLVLARELWVVKDRVRVLEAVLDERGIEVSAAVRDYRPSGAVEAELAEERERFSQAILRTLAPAVEAQ